MDCSEVSVSISHTKGSFHLQTEHAAAVAAVVVVVVVVARPCSASMQ
jgi:hypothetical protein